MDLFTRSLHNPILEPDPSHSWESRKVYNPGAVYHKGRYHLFYRAVGEGENAHSALGYAVSDDGEHFERFEKPILDRDSKNPSECRGYEDPRITKIDDTFYMAYAVYDGTTPRLHIATSHNLKEWERHGQALENFDFFKEGGVGVSWRRGKAIEHHSPKHSGGKNDLSKSGGIFPERVDGKYWMLFNEYKIWLAYSENGFQWKHIPGPFLEARAGTELFDSRFVEMGPPPIRTDKGWLVLYHGINDAIQYQLGVLLLDLEDPTKILFRSEEPVFGPRERYELSGIVDIIPGAVRLLREGNEEKLRALLKEAEQNGFMPQVTFVPAAVVIDGVIRLFYGAGDERICTATASFEDLLAVLP